MGFIKQKFSDNFGGLTVHFQNSENNEYYFSGDNVQEALEYFNMYVKDNVIYIRTNEELALREAGISSIEEANQLRQELNEISSSLTDEEALERPILFANWRTGVNYSVGARVRYGGRLFKVLQAHTSQDDWTPSRAPSLFAEILTNEDGEPLEWQRPSSTNPYLTGDLVIFDEKVYRSLIDYNTWSPEEYPAGWELVEDENGESGQQEIPEWQQPDAGNPYMIGDRVLFNGHTYESAIDNNVWSPETYPAGWTLIE